jgi:hypothetical protein
MANGFHGLWIYLRKPEWITGIIISNTNYKLIKNLSSGQMEARS